jgi:hypothetical protein
MHEQDLIEKLRKIERLHAGATTLGEREAAADAMLRIQRRLAETQKVEKSIEFRFSMVDEWSKKLFMALLRRYGLNPYRYARQRRNTVMVRVPASFVDQTLWPEFLDLSRSLSQYLAEVTERVIAEGIHRNTGEQDVVSGEFLGEPD